MSMANVLSILRDPHPALACEIAPAGIVARYEDPCRTVGLHPGLVTVSSLAMLELLPATGSLLMAHRSPGIITVIALDNGIVTIARSLELPEKKPGEDGVDELV